jgi:hypothetical protein
MGTLSIQAGNFLTANPALIHQLGSDALTHVIQRYVKKTRARKGVSRRIMRKTNNRKRRWFVDNIIMHHKRLHDRNRAIAVSNARTRALAKRSMREELSNQNQQSQTFQERAREKSPNHDPSESFKDRAESLRGRVDARRLRARSRWLSVMGNSEETTSS